MVSLGDHVTGCAIMAMLPSHELTIPLWCEDMALRQEEMAATWALTILNVWATVAVWNHGLLVPG